MMECLMKLPIDMFKLELLPYLTLYDIVRLDSAVMNHEYRPQFLDKISGGILRGENVTYLKGILLEWLHTRRIYLINVVLSHHLYYLNIFKYTEHIVIKDSDLLSHRENGRSSYFSNNIYISQADVTAVCEQCMNLKSLIIENCGGFNSCIMLISTQLTGLVYLHLGNCSTYITDDSIISICTHCAGLLSLYLDHCYDLTDTSIAAISVYCAGLHSLKLVSGLRITDASIISISIHCILLRTVYLPNCNKITDTSIIFLDFKY